MIQLKDLWNKIKFDMTFGLLWLVSTGLAITVRKKAVGFEHLEEMIASGKGGVIVIWHGVTILPIFYCRHRGLWAIISTSKDGELQNRLVKSRGFKTIRGSSGAHGVRAFLGAVKRIEEGAIFAITPDGPKGPERVVQHGSVLMAERAGCPVMAVGIACSPVKRLKSWDHHMIPMPFSKSVIVFRKPITIPASESDEDRQKWADFLAVEMNEAEAEAEKLLGGRG